MKRARLIICAIIILIFAIGINGSHFSFHGRPEGVYLLSGADGRLLELKDRLQLTEYARLIARIEFEAFYDRWRSRENAALGRPYLKYQWNRKKGTGYVISFFPDGTKFLACFGRFADAANNVVKGLFAGGGLPASHYESAALKTSETGAANFDGKEWHHLRQSIEESVFPLSAPSLRIKPGQWDFLGSEVLFASQFRLAIKSSHLARVENMPVEIDRYLIYHAGERFFTLVNRLTNKGTSPLGYHYLCGNELVQGGFCGAVNNGEWLRENSHTLLPGRSATVILTIGIAVHDAAGDTPQPVAAIAPEELRYFLSR